MSRIGVHLLVVLLPASFALCLFWGQIRKLDDSKQREEAMRFNHSKIKISGLWLKLIIRQQGTLLEYSLNAGKTFHLSKDRAYDAAYEQGNLDKPRITNRINPALEPTDTASGFPCSVCGQVFDVNRDLRIVNSRRNCTWPQPEYCENCWQVKSDALPVDSISEEEI
jgi:hypothetical protein